MSEEQVDPMAFLGQEALVLEGEDGTEQVIPIGPEEEDEGGSSGMLAGSKDGDAIDDEICKLFREHLEHPELACSMVAILNPGTAVASMGGGALSNMPPWQHLLISCVAIFTAILMTNPQLRARLMKSKKKPMLNGPRETPPPSNPDEEDWEQLQ